MYGGNIGCNWIGISYEWCTIQMQQKDRLIYDRSLLYSLIVWCMGPNVS